MRFLPRVAAVFALLSAVQSHALNRVGDADNDGAVNATDAGLTLARVLDAVDEWSLSPLALADADGDLDIGDVMRIAQAANGQRVLDGPGSLLSFSDPSSQSVASGEVPVPVFWGVYSNYPGVAENTDGMEAAFTVIPAASESYVIPTTTGVSGFLALTELTPVNTTGASQSATVRLRLRVLHSSGTSVLEDQVRNTAFLVGPSVCGNGWLQPGETCDDGNTINDCACLASCQLPAGCGDGSVCPGESCDDGNLTDGDGCSSGCTWSAAGCGNPPVNPNDLLGATYALELASGTCVTPAALCGDITYYFGDPNPIGISFRDSLAGGTLLTVSGSMLSGFCGPGATSATCFAPYPTPWTDAPFANPCFTTTVASLPGTTYRDLIYEGAVASDLQSITDIHFQMRMLGSFEICVFLFPGLCDMQGYIDFEFVGMTAHRIPGLTIPYCGDGVTEAPEACDDGNNVGGDGCREDCKGTEVCGDGLLDVAEACDDGDNDNCSTDCDAVCSGPVSPFVQCGNGTLECGELCDDGNLEDCDGCSGDCRVIESGCGDGVRCGAEICDDGLVNGQPNLCNLVCSGTTPAVCGNGKREAGEGCDDGALASGDGCDATCGKEPVCRMETVATWGGSPRNLDVEGSLAFVALQRGGLSIYDISNPASPVMLSHTDLGGPVHNVTVEGIYAYASVLGIGVRILNISNPSDPVLVSSVGWPSVLEVAVRGNQLYLAAETFLVALDISDPANPLVMEVLYLGINGAAQSLAVQDGLAYVANGYDGLLVVDIGTLMSMSVVGSAYSPGFVSKVTLGTGGAWVLDDYYGVSFVDTADPYDLQIYPGSGLPLPAYGLAVEGSTVHVASATLGLVAFDATVPSAPAEILYTNDGGALDVVAAGGGLVYLTGPGDEIRAVQISAGPSWSSVSRRPAASNVLSLAVSGSMAAVCDASYLHLLDAALPTQPAWLGALGLASGADAAAFAGSGTLAAARDDFSTVDITTPASPALLGTLSTPGTSTAIGVDGSTAYVAAGYDGLLIVDIAVPAAPTLLGGYNTFGYANDVLVVGTVAYVADDYNGLELLDVSNPAMVSTTLNLLGTDRVMALSREGSRLAVSNLSDVYVYDISTPSAPVQSSYFLPGIMVNDVELAGDFIIISQLSSDVDIWSIANPLVPVQVPLSDIPRDPVSITQDGANLWVADGAAGVRVMGPLPHACTPVCGNSQLEYFEGCDDGNLANGDGCDSSCQPASFCGDSVQDIGETCDDGSGGLCLDDCSGYAVCGDGTPFGDEVCDDGPGGPCFDDCTALNTCGDGVIWEAEACDDGNTTPGDGCDATCQTE